MIPSLTVLLAAAPFAFAFSNTAPVIAWSESHLSAALDGLPSYLPSVAALNHLLANDAVCSSDAILVVEHPGLHASDLRNLPKSSPLAVAIEESPSSRQWPYVSAVEAEVLEIAENISLHCKSRLVDFTVGQGSVKLSPGEKHVIRIRLPYLEGLAIMRHNALLSHVETLFVEELSRVVAAFPNHLVLYSGSASTIHKRQSINDNTRPVLQATDTASNATLPMGGILKRYQLLTPELITVLLVACFVLFPILFVGIFALSSIQSPLRVEAPKGYSDRERKNQ